MMTSINLKNGALIQDSFLATSFLDQLQCGVITELFGEAGSGKTQICLQTALSCWKRGAVYICTEDTFPTKRLNQMIQSLDEYDPNVDYGGKIFIEHIAEVDDLLQCIKTRLPVLLERNIIDIIIVDSIAAPFRAAYSNYALRAQHLREVAFGLLRMGRKHRFPILCTNQATASMNDVGESIEPALGLAWSNLVTTRMRVRKTDQIENGCPLREIKIIFSPHQANTVEMFLVHNGGVSKCMERNVCSS